MTAHAPISGPAMRYHGAKFRIAPWVMSYFPHHRTYVEAFGGAAGVLIQKPRAYGEVYNDLDGEIVNFFRVLQSPLDRERLIELLVLTPYARQEFERAWESTDDRVELARRIAIRASMGFGSAGASKGSTGFRIDTNRDYGTAQSVWAKYPGRLAAIGQRFTGVLIENAPATDVIRNHDREDTLHFVDPPYVLSTRNIGQSASYRHEMTDEQHVELIAGLQVAKGMVVLCGYASELYLDLLKGWHSFSMTARISAGRGVGLRTEMLWLNDACFDAYSRKSGVLL